MAPRRGGWWVYVLRCRDGSLYTGATNDLGRRVLVHACGRGGRYTRSRLPVVLVHSEPARDRSAALRREAAVKRLSRVEKLALVKGPAAPGATARGRSGGGALRRRPARRAPRRGAPRSPSPSRRPPSGS